MKRIIIHKLNKLLKRKRMLFLFLLLTVLGFLIQVIITYTSENQQSTSKIIQNFTIKENTSILRNNKQWIVNGNVIQYSTLTLINSHTNTIRVESMALLNYKYKSVWKNLSRLTCLVKHNKVVLQMNPIQFLKIYLWDAQNRFFYKIICNHKWNYSPTEEISVAIINIDEFQIDNYDTTVHHNNSKYPKEYIQYQSVDIIDALKPKIPKVAHCVHFARVKDNVETERLFNWIQIQKIIGIDQITFYNYSMSDIVIKEIETKNYQDFVKIVQYKMDLDCVCETQIKLTKNNPHSELFKQMFEQCKSICDKHFNQSEGIIIEIHGGINTNVCLTHYRYRYQFVTNYDFDEFIIPSGSLAMYNNLTCLPEDLSNLNYSSSFNINDMAFSLFKKKQRIFDLACLRFENVLFIYDTDDLHDFIKRLPFDIQGSILVDLKTSNNKKISFKITKYDLNLVRGIKQSYELFKCLKSKYMNNSRLNGLFNNAVASVVNMREGKSIYNTDHTISVHQHSADKMTFYSYCIKIPTEDGYAAHFRNNIDDFFLNQTYPLSYLQVNLDYYKFLIKYVAAYD